MSTPERERQVKAWPFLYSVEPGQPGLVKNVPRVRVKLTAEAVLQPAKIDPACPWPFPRQRVRLTSQAAHPELWGPDAPPF